MSYTRQAERERREAKRRVLQLARESDELEAKAKVDVYNIPTSYVDENAGRRDKSKQEVVVRARSYIFGIAMPGH